MQIIITILAIVLIIFLTIISQNGQDNKRKKGSVFSFDGVEGGREPDPLPNFNNDYDDDYDDNDCCDDCDCDD